MIKLITVGKMNQKYLNEGIKYYQKQIPYKFEIIEVKDGKDEQAIKNEGEAILKQIHDSDFVIALAIKGQMFSSEEFSQKIEDTMSYHTNDIVFVIGGSYGLSNEVYERCQLLISFSKMTFPHQMMRLIFIEQLYRAFMIMKNHPYHK
ncbi:MAG: 23S rRNA (pseudouridine(1915)-N(3))-methyltransferase RlmH [Acholeplasmataceae bacterium]